MARFIGIRHRVKRTADGEAKPTLVTIRHEDGEIRLKLEDEQAELDFVNNKFPVSWRPVNEGEDISGFAKHHLVYEKPAKGEKKIKDPKVVEVPDKYEGLQAGDTVAPKRSAPR